jgi:thioesterase domain-containing protein
LWLAAAWLLVHWRLSDRVPAPTVVIAEQRVTYERPILGALTARAAMPDQASWREFEGALERRGRGRIAMTATIEGDGALAARFEGSFVATGG